LNRNLIEKYLPTFIILLVILFGFYLCFIGGYGSDEDTLPMLYVFEARLADGRFVTSRFTSYPIPEIGIGFLSYFFGSFAVNSVTFLFHILGLLLIYFSLNKKIDFYKLNLFLILSLSSPILFFENLEPMDYSWAFLFFSLGTFFYSRKIFELAILGFGFAIGCRINFLIFIIIFIYFYNFRENISLKKKALIFLNIFVIGGLFYLPIWFDNGFGLNWITAARPIEQGFFGLVARFSYKSVMTFGLIQLILILYFFAKLRINKNSEVRALIFLTISNFALFLYIPAEKSYLQPAIIFVNLILIDQFSKKIIMLLIFFNFMSWIVSYDFLKINYKDDSLCAPKHAISASFQLNFSKGAVKNFYESREMIACWVNINTERGKRIIEGKSTRIK
tara:strand:+ start:328 stop:1500 length:1173 start_codon:yes stop_codon:yes gene_type:complete